MLHFDDIVFGPIKSRRLGSSLGVNLLPSKGKLCNFDCIYCECGWNKDGEQGRTPLPSFEDVKAALSERIRVLSEEGSAVDSITFSGNGEPTIHPDFPEIVDVVLELRDRYYPEAILKIDASDDRLISLINKPAGHYRLEDVIGWMKEFDGNFVLQTMFLRSDEFDLSEPEQLGRWMDIVRYLSPREVMVYTIDRETPDKSLGKYTVEEMKAFVAPLIDEGYKIQIRG